MNLPTVIVASVIALVVIAIIVNEIKKRKDGKGGCSCGGSCPGCAMNGTCHKPKDEE